MKFSEIYSSLFNEWYKIQLEYIERFLKNSLRKQDDDIIKQEILLLLLICLLKKHSIETVEMKEYFEQFIKISFKAEKDILRYYSSNNPTTASKMLLDVFYKTNNHRLNKLEINYNNLDMIDRASKIKVLRKDFLKNEAFIKKDYKSYFYYWLDKIFSNYWTSFLYLLNVILITIFVFGILYLACDFFSGKYYVGNWEIQTLSYYIYVSLATFSNLWADLSMAWTLFLRILFWIEQIIWLIAFWIFVILVSKKFNN